MRLLRRLQRPLPKARRNLKYHHAREAPLIDMPNGLWDSAKLGALGLLLVEKTRDFIKPGHIPTDPFEVLAYGVHAIGYGLIAIAGLEAVIGVKDSLVTKAEAMLGK